MLVGGVLGVLFVILLRRTLVEDAELPFPESAACAELVKAGQKGESGARYVFGAIGLQRSWSCSRTRAASRSSPGRRSGSCKFPPSLVNHGSPSIRSAR